MKMQGSDKCLKIFANFTVLLMTLCFLYPLLLVISASISDEYLVQINGIKLIPEKLSLDTYRYLFKNGSDWIFQSYKVTIFVTIAGMALSLLVTSMLAYTMSSKNVKYRTHISFYCYFTMIFQAGIVPFYIMCVNYYGLSNKLWALIIPYTVNVWLLFLLRNYFMGIPVSLLESAKIDGASEFTILFKIVLPLAKVGLLTIGMFYALQYWNDWWLSILFIRDDNKIPLQYKLFSIVSNAAFLGSSDLGAAVAGKITIPTETVKMAATVITIGPIVLVYPFIQKYFVKGIMIGAVKG